ncbi:MAG: hypothetical protein AB7D57_02590 [Desulfovibrionaceae bacterium]
MNGFFQRWRRPAPETQSQAEPAQAHRPKLLVVSRSPGFDAHLASYSAGMASRLDGRILALSVNTLPDYYEEDEQGRSAFRQVFRRKAARAAEDFARQAEAHNVPFTHLCKTGRVDNAVDEVFRDQPDIDIVLLEPGIVRERIAASVPVPVFSLARVRERAERASRSKQTGRRAGLDGNAKPKGATFMAEMTRKQAARRAAVFGVLAIGLYAAVFTHTDFIMKYWTQGGVSALLPVATVFLFSYVHGSFASNFWTAIGIQASRTTRKKVTEQPTKRPDARPRATLQA